MRALERIGQATDGHVDIDRQMARLRWLVLLGAAAVVLLDAIVSQRGLSEPDTLLPEALVIAAAGLYNATVVFFLLRSSLSHIVPLFTLALDTLLIIGLILSSGALGSPLLFFAMFPTLSAALRFSAPAGLAIALGVVASVGGAIYLASPPASWSAALPVLSLALTLVLGAVASSVLSARVRRTIARRKQVEIEAERRKLRAAREHSRLTFELASTLTATLDYNRVLRAVLEVGEKGMQELGRDLASQVGAVLLFGEADLRIVAWRHLPPRDRTVTFDSETGVLAEALKTGEAVLLDRPFEDPQLGKLVSMGRCRQAAVVPLAAGFESFGAVVFGNSEPNIYSDDLVNLLTAVCNQATIALQNAQLYRDLQEEKERIVAVEEDARKKLARDLHDGPTQSIASIAMLVSFVRTLTENGTSSDRVVSELEKIEDLARRTTKQIRNMLFTLRPRILETQGLQAALEQYVSKLADTDDTVISLEADPEAENSLDQEAQNIVFHVVEEAVSNARKHAEATRIWVRLYRPDGGFVVAEVEDDGIGFDVEAVETAYDERGSLGLINMRERAAMARGKLSVTSGPGGGTQVRLSIPVARSA